MTKHGMLVLSRKKNETIVITSPDGVRVTIMVCEIVTMPSKKVRIGINAPPTWSVHRSEVQAKLDEEMSDD